MTTLTTAELAVIRLALQRLPRMRNLELVVLFPDSCGALLQLADEARTPPFVREIAYLLPLCGKQNGYFLSSGFRRIVPLKRTNMRTCWLPPPTFKFPESPLTDITHLGD